MHRYDALFQNGTIAQTIYKKITCEEKYYYSFIVSNYLGKLF